MKEMYRHAAHSRALVHKVLTTHSVPFLVLSTHPQDRIGDIGCPNTQCTKKLPNNDSERITKAKPRLLVNTHTP